ncbi:MAG: very short patch repair endonuclease [Henriciella sp.]
MDIVDKKTRSRMMAGIGGKDTKPELALRRALHSRGYRYRLHARKLPGRPDIVLMKYNAVVFVHGCFWHRHRDCRFATTPSTRPEFWAEKFNKNVERDTRNLAALRASGWRTSVVWECSLSTARLTDTVNRLDEWLIGDATQLEI